MKLFVDSSETIHSFLRVAQSIRAQLNDVLAEFDLNDIRYAALRHVHSAETEDYSQTELAAELNQAESSVSSLVDRMRSDGLLYRIRSASDRRRWVLMVTDRGRQSLEAAERAVAAWSHDLMCSHESKSYRELAHAVATLHAAITDRFPVSSADDSLFDAAA